MSDEMGTISEAVSLFSMFFQEQHQLFKDQMKRLQKLERKIQEKVVAGGGTVTINVDGDSDEERAEKKGKDEKAKKPKKVKDPNEPKKPKSAYIFYVEEHQPAIKNANPGSKPNEIFAILGAKWKALDDSKKKKYNDMSDKAKKEYATAYEKYKSGSANGSSSSTSPLKRSLQDDDKDAKKKKKEKKSKK